MRFVLLTIILLTSSVVFSQDYVLNLESSESEKIYSFKIVSVIDQREVQGDSVKLGITKVGAFNKIAPIYLENGFATIENYLLGFARYKEKAEPVKIEVTYLTVTEEESSGFELAVANVGIRIRRQDNEGWKVVFADTVKVSQKDWDASSLLPEVTQLAFTTLLNRAQNSFPNWFFLVDGKPASMSSDETAYYNPNEPKTLTESEKEIE